MRIVILLCALLVQTCYSCSFHPPEKCLSPTSEELCRCTRIKKTLLCCHITSEYVFKESIACADILRNDTEHLYIYNATLDNFDASLKSWTHLHSLTITHSKLKKVTGWFRGSLKCVNFSSNALSEIDSKAFAELSSLGSLDLSKNNLDKLPNLSIRKKNFTLDISGNAQLWCHSVKDLLELDLNNNLKFSNRNSTQCRALTSFQWFNSTELMSLAQVEILQRLEQECPKGPNYQCNCSQYRIDFLPGKPPTYTIKVNCSGRHLTELPRQLPPNTILLDVSNNNITSLDLLSTNPSYHDIREFVADNNRIESITTLEGSSFIDNFAILSIRENSLKTIPTYILSNTFDRNWHPRHVKLGGNKLSCDCSTAQVLKLWLLANKDHIPDYDELLCEKDLERVKYLDQNKVCVYQKDWTDYIYYIIAGEILLLLLLVSKVSYDYWVFKTSGYLPWPASNMPKLPCDWVFET